MPSGYRLDWYGEQRRSQILAELVRRLNACVRIVANRAKVLLSKEGTLTVGGDKRDKKTGRFKKRIYGAKPSKPGEPPAKQTGHLRRSVAYEVLGQVGRVGTAIWYGLWLELGTKRIKPRPWLLRALNESRAQIQTILRKPMR